VTAAATGAIAGAVLVLGRRAVVDPATAAIALLALVAAWKLPMLPEPLLLLVAGIAGVLLRPAQEAVSRLMIR
jgi:chromate transporter